MRRRIPPMVAIVVAVLAACEPVSSFARALHRRSAPVYRAPSPDTIRLASGLRVILLDGRPASVLEVPPSEMRTALRRADRLLPDARFLLAVADVHRLLTGSPRSDLVLDPAGGHWSVSYAGRPVGVLPALPSYSDASDLLERWAGSLTSQAAPPSRPLSDAVADSINRGLEAFYSADVARSLNRADELWRAGNRSPRVAALLARGLVLLRQQSLDALGIADALSARALAALAVARALGAPNLAGEDALLAADMEYETEARVRAAGLAAGDAIRLFLLGDTAALRSRAQAGNDRLATYLYAQSLAATGHGPRFARWLDAHPPDRPDAVAWLAVGTRIGRYEAYAFFPGKLPASAVAELREALEPRGGAAAANGRPRGFDADSGVWAPGEEPAQLLPRFDEGARALALRFPGPFLDGVLYGTYLRAQIYSGYYILAVYLLDDDPQAAVALADGLSHAPPGVGSQFYRWLRIFVDLRDGRAGSQELADAVWTLPLLGAPPAVHAYEELDQWIDPRVTERRQVARRLLHRLDSRPRAAREAARLVSDVFWDGRLLLALWDHAARLTGDGYLRSWMARVRRDSAEERRILEDAAVRPYDRLNHLLDLARARRIPAEEADRRARSIVAADPGRWTLVEQYARYLIERKRFAEAEVLLRSWLSDPDPETFFDPVNARVRLAEALSGRGEHATALEVLEPALASGAGGPLGWRARILDRLGRPEEAEAAVERTLSAYPTSGWTRALAAEIYWSHGRPERAAAVLAQSGYSIDMTVWREIVGPAFAHVFRDRPEGDAAAAMRPLAATSIDPGLLEVIPLALADSGRAAHAFATQALIRGAAGPTGVEPPVRAYGYLASARGRGPALSWLRGRLPENVRGVATLAAYQDDLPDLLWDLVPDPASGEEGEFVWLLRAAASVSAGPRDSRRPDLLKHYRDRSGGDYHLMGRYLLGLAGEQDLLALAQSPRRRCEVAYYAGVRAEAEHRIGDAVDWYRVAMDTGDTMAGEAHWAEYALRRLSRTAMTKLATERPTP